LRHEGIIQQGLPLFACACWPRSFALALKQIWGKDGKAYGQQREAGVGDKTTTTDDDD